MKGLLFASFGTSYDEAREKHLDAVAHYLHDAMPEYRLAQAYTSNKVRGILARRGIEVPDTTQALQQFADEGVTQVLAVPGHLLLGEEFNKLRDQVRASAGLFDSIALADPLISSSSDLQDLAEALSAYYPKEEGIAKVLMGHGTRQFANAAYAALDHHFTSSGREDVFVGCVEAYPDPDVVLELVGLSGARRVELAPLMLVAGDHIVNDMAGSDPDSWASRFKAAGYEVVCRMVGLGEIDRVQELYLGHANRAREMSLPALVQGSPV